MEYLYRCAKCGESGWHRSTKTKPQICRHRVDIYQTMTSRPDRQAAGRVAVKRGGKHVEVSERPEMETR